MNYIDSQTKWKSNKHFLLALYLVCGKRTSFSREAINVCGS